MKMTEVIAKIVIAVVLGGLSPLVFIIGAEPFEVSGRTSFAEIFSGSLALAAYLAFCQFKLALKGEEPGSATTWPVGIAMAAPLPVWLAFMACVENYWTVLTQGLPMLAAGCCGIMTGAVLAARRAGNKKAAASACAR